MTAASKPRVGNWMQTYSGRAFYPLDPRPEEIDPKDIAHALSLLCRFGGHATRFYSVAEHCVLMSLAVSRENALWALLHDATEAYVGDMVRPLKRMLPDYSTVEDTLMGVISYKFGIDPVFPEEVHEADNRILVNERQALMADPPFAWETDDLQPLPVSITGWQPTTAEAMYQIRLDQLLGAAA